MIDFPDLRAGAASRLVACGAIESGKRELIEWLSVRRNLIATYTRGKRRYFVRLLTGGKPKHFHLEVVAATWFPNKVQPTTTSDISEIQHAAEMVLGEKIDLTVTAEFRLRFGQLAELGPIRILSTQTQAGGTSIRLTEGVLSLEGSRIHEIAWKRLSAEDVSVTLKSRVESVVASRYLVGTLEMMERFYFVLVLGLPTSDA
ncbi:MAG: hypothetical protein ABR526_08960 [Chthoniobacterales bacterium]